MNFAHIQHTIADAQYAGVLKNFSDSQLPSEPIPTPPEVEFEQFLASRTRHVTVRTLLSSPLGTHFFEKYCSKFLNTTIIIRFLQEFWHFVDDAAPDLSSVERLLELSLELPGQFEMEVAQLVKDITLLPVDTLVALDLNFLTSSNSDRKNSREAALAETEDEAEPEEPEIEVASPVEVEKNVFKNRLQRKRHRGGAQNFTVLSVFEPIPVDKAVQDESVPELATSPAQVTVEPEEEGQEVLDMKAEFDRRQYRRNNLQELFTKLSNAVEARTVVFVNNFKASELFQDYMHYMWYVSQPISTRDFQRYRDIGLGAFGVVSTVKTKTTGTMCALKAMSKKLIKGQKAKGLVKAERDILQHLGDHPSNFTIWLKYAYQDAGYFYLCLPLCTGGDLRYHLQHADHKCFKRDRAQFYTAEVFEGLVHLHSLGIIYRDLKPENIILDSQGHSRISDMGLAVRVGRRKAKGKAGTPGYWAPEVLAKKEYSFEADYWSLGSMVYEFLFGQVPFTTMNTGLTRDEATRKWKVQIPENNPHGALGRPCRFLIRSLLDRNPKKRYGSTKVRNCEWFRNFNWEELRDREVKPPFVPAEGQVHAKKQVDINYEKQEKRFAKAVLEPKDKIRNFEYVSVAAHEQDVVKVLHLQKKLRAKAKEAERAKASKGGFLPRLGLRKGKRRN